MGIICIFAASNYLIRYYMKIEFKEEALAEMYETGKTENRKYKQICKRKKIIEGYIRAVKIMYEVVSTEDLKNFSFLHYEKLKYQRGENRSSIRLANGSVERLIFSETVDGIEVELIEINSTHYGNKR